MELPIYVDQLPENYHDLTIREALARSQTNVTADDRLGHQYAMAAYVLAREQQTGIDFTAPGEAAAKACLRLTLAEGGMTDDAWKWGQMSLGALNSPAPYIQRERIASYITIGRAYAYDNYHNDRTKPALIRQARDTFESGNRIAQKQHQSWKPWDRYATMLSLHYAVQESRDENTTRVQSVKIALQGLRRALYTSRNNPVTRENPRIGIVAHAKFVGKHALIGSAVALGTTLSRPKNLNSHSRWDQMHRKIVVRALGGKHANKRPTQPLARHRQHQEV